MSEETELEEPDGAPPRNRRVTVGVDGSASADAAFAWAAGEARRRGAALHVLTVVDAVVDTMPMAEAVRDPRLRREAKRALALHNRLAERFENVGGGLEVEFELLAGDPTHLLRAAAAASGLVVVGSRGGGGYAGLPVGSVTLRLAGSCECPLAIVPLGHIAVGHAGPAVVGFDSRENPGVLAYAVEHAVRLSGELRVVHALTPHPAYAGAEYVSDTDTTARKFSQEIAVWLKDGHVADSGVATRVSVERGRADQVLVRLSARASMLVLGTRRRPAVHTLGVGSVLSHVLMHARCPVAIVPD